MAFCFTGHFRLSCLSYRGGLSQSLHIAYRGLAEEPLVLAAEVRGVVVAHPVPGARGVEPLAQHEAARFLEPQLLLKLERAHRRDGLEVIVEAREAHTK